MKPKLCPYCGGPLTVDDHSPIGGPKEYWSCDECGQEQVMFGVAK